MARIRSDWGKRQEDNFDKYRFWKGTEGLSTVWRIALKNGADRGRYSVRLASYLRNSKRIQCASDTTKDEESKRLLVSVMSYRALGRRHVRLPLNNPQYWQSIEMIERDLVRRHRAFDLGSHGFL